MTTALDMCARIQSVFDETIREVSRRRQTKMQQLGGRYKQFCLVDTASSQLVGRCQTMEWRRGLRWTRFPDRSRQDIESESLGATALNKAGH